MASPWEACSAVATAVGPHGVNGRVALVGRGTCTFAQKALNVQAGGAVAMIVTNHADGILNMGAYSDSDVAAVTIPLVLVMQADGSALQAAVEGGDTVEPEPRAPSPEPLAPSPEPRARALHRPSPLTVTPTQVTLELYDPARASTQLRDGLPQQSSLRAEAIEYFTFRAGAPPASCSAASSAAPGGGAQCTDDDAQMARRCAQADDCGGGTPLGQMDTCAAALGHYRGIGGGGLRAACATTLPAPQGRQSTLADVCCASCAARCDCEAVSVAVTASYGDVDLYVRAGGYPTRTRFDWSSSRGSGGGGGQASAVRRSGHSLDDAVLIRPDDPAALAGCNGTYYVGVYARLASAYHVLASSASSVISLQLGVPTFERAEAHPTHPPTLAVALPLSPQPLALSP